MKNSNGKNILKLNLSLVLSIFIVVLCVVALSTATFAWFSSNNTVNLTQIEFTAASNNTTENGDLYISWDLNDIDKKYEISFAPATSTIMPMMPKNKLAVDMTYEDFLNNFNTCGISINGNESYYISNGRTATPYTCSNPDNISQGDFYVKNGMVTNSGTSKYIVNITYEMTGQLKDVLKIAVFSNDKLVGVLTNNGKIYYGDIKSGTKVSDTTFDEDISFLSGDLEFEVLENSTISMRFVAWYDGVNLLDADAGKTATLTNIQFNGSPSF